jgi:hypothetical protein
LEVKGAIGNQSSQNCAALEIDGAASKRSFGMAQKVVQADLRFEGKL